MPHAAGTPVHGHRLRQCSRSATWCTCWCSKAELGLTLRFPLHPVCLRCPGHLSRSAPTPQPDCIRTHQPDPRSFTTAEHCALAPQPMTHARSVHSKCSSPPHHPNPDLNCRPSRLPARTPSPRLPAGQELLQHCRLRAVAQDLWRDGRGEQGAAGHPPGPCADGGQGAALGGRGGRPGGRHCVRRRLRDRWARTAGRAE